MGSRVSFDGFDVGFNDQVERGERSFHVQTEVAGRKEKYVRSTVMERGTLLFSERQPCPDDGDPERFRAVVETHHKRIVKMVERGEIE